MNTLHALYTRAKTAGEKAFDNLEAFYSRPLGIVAWLVTSLYLAYAGGAVMFWVHALYRGEAGPAINDVAHWLLDSTLGFVALTPAVFFLLPLALWAAKCLHGDRPITRTTSFIALVGSAFGVVTVPGPMIHNLLVGAGSTLGRAAESVLGYDPAVAARNVHAPDHSAFSEGFVQLFVGVPVYLVAAALALVTVRVALQLRRRSVGAPAAFRRGLAKNRSIQTTRLVSPRSLEAFRIVHTVDYKKGARHGTLTATKRRRDIRRPEG